MSWLYYNSPDNEYRYALGDVQPMPSKLLLCFGINPSKATPTKLDPTAKRIEKIAKEHGYDSWIILNLCPKRTTDPNGMEESQATIPHKENLEIITKLLNEYCELSDILFAYGDLIEKRSYLKKNLFEIINVIKASKHNGNYYCLGKTKAGNPRHPLYQKTSTSFVPYSLEVHTYSQITFLQDNRCAIGEYSESGV